jgi:hypothetical protein
MSGILTERRRIVNRFRLLRTDRSHLRVGWGLPGERRDQTVNQASKLKQSRRTDPRETLRRRFNGQLQLDPGEH